MNRFHLLPLLLLWLLSKQIPLLAQSIRGKVLDAATGRALENVNVVLLHTSVTAVSDREGHFALFLGSSPATHVLRASSVGYEAEEQVLEWPKQEPLVLTIALRPALIQLHKAIVVTGRRTETRQFNSPEAISVLTQTQLQQDVPRSTPEALTGLTGVWVQKTNHGGGSPFLRGLTGQQTLLLVDGIRLNNATFRSGPNQYLSLIDPQSIDQMEVARGSGSVQYGSDALGGTVQIITRNPQFSWNGTRFSGRVYTKYMSADMEKSGRAEVGLSSGKVAVLGALAYRDFGDIRAGGKVGFQRPTGYTQLSGDLKARFRLGDKQLLTLAYQLVDQDNVPIFHRVKLENFAYNQFEPQQRQLTYARWESFHESKWIRSIQMTGLLQQWTEGRQSQKNDSPTRVEERDEVKTWGATLVVRSEPGTHWTFNSGLEYYHDKVGSTRNDVHTLTRAVTPRRGLYPDGSTYASLAAYSLHTFQLPGLTVSAGARFNAFAISATENTLGKSTIRPSALVGNASATYELHPGHRLVASVNTAFRAPNVDDLGTLGIVDFRYEVPNNDLKPEKSLNLELGWKAKTERFAASLALYHNRLTDIITRIRQGSDSVQGYPVYLKENTARAYIQGLEAEAEVQLATHLAAYSNLTYTYGQNQTAREPFRRIPPLNGLLGVRYQQPTGFWARAEWMAATKQGRLARGDQDDNRIPRGGTPGWGLVHLYAGYRTGGWNVSASLLNLFDQAYRTHGSGVDGYGRTFQLSGSVWF